ncbi:hypothetical protein ACU686_06910 [Yinghuangia aomiensis]
MAGRDAGARGELEPYEPQAYDPQVYDPQASRRVRRRRVRRVRGVRRPGRPGPSDRRADRLVRRRPRARPHARPHGKPHTGPAADRALPARVEPSGAEAARCRPRAAARRPRRQLEEAPGSALAGGMVAFLGVFGYWGWSYYQGDPRSVQEGDCIAALTGDDIRPASCRDPNVEFRGGDLHQYGGHGGVHVGARLHQSAGGQARRAQRRVCVGPK